jgi:outer membrane protein assembly factor BamB
MGGGHGRRRARRPASVGLSWLALLAFVGTGELVVLTDAAAHETGTTRPAHGVATAVAGDAGPVVPALHQMWRVRLEDGPHATVVLGSPSLATLRGGPAVVFGDRSGHVYALDLASGAPVPGWPKYVGVPVTSTPSVLKDPGSPYDTVFVGTGDAAEPCAGGYEWLLPTGAGGLVRGPNPSADHACGADGVFAGIAIGPLGAVTGAVAGTLGQETYAFNATTRRVLPGFPWFQADSNFATPAIADVEGDGTNQIVEGGAQTPGLAFGRRYTQGGHIRILSATGKLLCEDTTDESINSSPAVGAFLARTAIGIVAGTGPTFPTASQHDEVIAVNTDCHEVWARKLSGTTGYESPALADVLNDGQLQVLVTTHDGGVWALDGATGATLWCTQLRHDVYGSPVTVELGTGHQDVVVATTSGFDVMTGEHGHVLDATVTRTTGFQNTPLVTKDANGTIGITVVGYQRSGSVVTHFEVVGSESDNVDGPGAWPQFHHDPQLTGNAASPIAAPSPASH